MSDAAETTWIDRGTGREPNPALSPEAFQARLDEATAANLAALWQAAHEYEFSEISGSAVGLLVLGVMQAQPKCQAVQAWIQSIWSLYYQRKPLVTSDHDPALLDFTACGPCPHTVPELMAELGM